MLGTQKCYIFYIGLESTAVGERRGGRTGGGYERVMGWSGVEGREDRGGVGMRG